MRYSKHLETAIRAAKLAGTLLLADMRRPDGPRGHGSKAPADDEAEALIRNILEAKFPDHGIVGEELTARDKTSIDGLHTWWIDPNDGTAAYLRGFRGASVSIGLTRNGLPVLGVVFAYAAPDDDGDLIAWAEDQPLTRNGVPIKRAPWPTGLTSDVVVAVSQDSDKLSNANAILVAPARFYAVPSIAYRLALVAVGEADVGVSLAYPGRWDCAAAHALLRASDGDLYDFGGAALRYNTAWNANVIGGAPELCNPLRGRPWRETIFGAPKATRPTEFGKLDLLYPSPGRHIDDAGLLSRAQGTLLGQLAGDALGQLVEFETAQTIAQRYPEGVRTLHDGGTYGTLAGQPTDDSEMALILSRGLILDGEYRPETAAQGYARWLMSGPYDLGNTTRTALNPAVKALQDDTGAAPAARAAASHQSQANGALMRISPLGIWGHTRDPNELARFARADAVLTHPHPVCQDASALLACAIAYAVRSGAAPKDVYEFTCLRANNPDIHTDIRAALLAAKDGPPDEFQHQMGWVLIAFRNAFAQLLHATSFEDGVVDSIGRGGDTDTNGAIAGALLGAVYGRQAVPSAWRRRLVTCRAISGLHDVRHPRPRVFWPVDALLVAEELLLAGQVSARTTSEHSPY